LGRGRIEIGDHSGLSGTVLSARSLIQIGQRVLIGGNVRIFDHDFHPTGWQERCAGDPGATRPVVIGDDVFIGTNVIVLKGVQIGERSVIGAGSVVTLSEIPPDSLVAGNPAKIVRRL
jgi:acetyltransferase-like isoleucine patch superfamily enzyme